MIEVNPNVGNGAFAAIEILSVHDPGEEGAMIAEFCNLHEPFTTLTVRAPFEGLRSSSLNGVVVFGERVEVVIHAPDSGSVVAEKYIFVIDPLGPLFTDTE